MILSPFVVLLSPGDLQSVDGYMNIALERCTEVAEGRVTRNWGDAFVRGNNGMFTFLDPYLYVDLVCSHIHLRRQRIGLEAWISSIKYYFVPS